MEEFRGFAFCAMMWKGVFVIWSNLEKGKENENSGRILRFFLVIPIDVLPWHSAGVWGIWPFVYTMFSQPSDDSKAELNNPKFVVCSNRFRCREASTCIGGETVGIYSA
jgi:hypothetical protein